MNPITDIQVNLSRDGNAFIMIGKVRAALRRGGRADLVEAFTKEAESGDDDHVLQACMKYVDVS